MHRFAFSGSLLVLFMAVLCVLGGPGKDSPKAAVTRKKLREKVTVEFADTSLDDAMEEIKNQIKGLGVHYDTGVSRNLNITFKSAAVPLAEALAGMFKKNGLGYIVISKEGNAYDGNLLIKQGPERGYPAGEEPDKDGSKAKDKADPDKKIAKGKGKSKDKAAAKEDAEDNDKTAGKGKAAPKEPAEEDSDKAEQDAARKLNFAKTLLSDGKTAKAKERLGDIVTKYPKTKAAESAKEILKKLNDE